MPTSSHQKTTLDLTPRPVTGRNLLGPRLNSCARAGRNTQNQSWLINDPRLGSYLHCIITKLEVISYPDDILVSLTETKGIDNRWFGLLINQKKLHELWRAAASAFISVVCINVLLGGSEYSVKCARFIRQLLTAIRKIVVSLMPRDGLQLAALAREIASLKGSLSFLWNTERQRRECARQTGSPAVGVPSRSCGFVTCPVHSPFQFQIGVVLLSGLIIGCAIALGSVCLGVWIGHNL